MRRRRRRYRRRQPSGSDPPVRCSLRLPLARVLDLGELVELDVEIPAVDLLYLADVDVLDDVPGHRIDADRAARSLNAFMNATAVSPAGVKMKTASGLASLIRWTNGANSGFLSGTRSDPITSPPFAANTFLNVVSASSPGP